MKKKAPVKKKRISPQQKIVNELHEEMETIKNSLSQAILGFNPANIGTQIQQADTLFINNRWYLVSNMRQLMSEIYVEHGIVQTVVDVPVDDALRGGIEVISEQISPNELKELQATMEQENDIGTFGQALKWNRLFGGAAVMVIAEDDFEKPLIVENIKQGSNIDFKAVDMWELFWDKQNVEGYNEPLQRNEFEHYSYYTKQVHKSRVFRMTGIAAPSFIRPRLRGWGLSVVEAIVNSINQYLKANNLIFEVLDEFKIDVYKIKNLANTLLSANGASKVRERIQLANQEKSFQHAVTMDAEDDFQSKEISFRGIAETMQGIRIKLASDLRMPLTKVFGIPSTGFSSGEDDIENYNGMIESTIRDKYKYDLLKIVGIRCQQLFGHVPDDLTIEFKALRMLGAEQEENVKTAKFNRLLAAKQAGEMTTKEFKEACNKDRLLGIQIDTNIDTIPPEVPEGAEEGEAPTGTKATSSTTKSPTAKNSLDNLGDWLNSNTAIDKDEHGDRVACVGITSGGYVLTGKRKDDGLWTFPAGHLETNESGINGALRETWEESGIGLLQGEMRPLQPVVKGKIKIYPFMVQLKSRPMPRITLDPDCEVSTWQWVKISKDTPELKQESRHVKSDLIMKELFK